MRKDLKEIPRGDTCPGVNEAVIRYLLDHFSARSNIRLLDIPCGNGELLDTIKKIFPTWETTGVDLREPVSFNHCFFKFDAESSERLAIEGQFNIVTCISGVMEFDNTLSFFKEIEHVSDEKMTLIVSNDNLLSVRDRLMFLLFGRFGQYPLTISSVASTWKMLHLTNLIRILRDAGFEVTTIKYVVGSALDWLWLPVACPLFLIQKLYLSTNRGRRSLGGYLPLSSMIARHYLLGCVKKTNLRSSVTAAEEPN